MFFRTLLARKQTANSAIPYCSQHGQDRFLDEVVFKGKKGGVFVEVGACDGVYLSNTFFFEKSRGWKGICVEPRRSQFSKLRKNRSCVCLDVCIAASPGKEQFTEYRGDWLPALSGLERNFYSEHHSKVQEGLEYGNRAVRYSVRTETLANVLKSHKITTVDYCSIDVEGSEIDVLRSIDFKATEIYAFSVENNYANPHIEAFLKERGYKLIHEIGMPNHSLDQIYLSVKPQ